MESYNKDSSKTGWLVTQMESYNKDSSKTGWLVIQMESYNKDSSKKKKKLFVSDLAQILTHDSMANFMIFCTLETILSTKMWEKKPFESLKQL